jgi:hypothetical protein
MKKLVYTLSFVTLLGIAGKAQTMEPAKQDPKKGDGKPATITPVPNSEEPKSRMAITQKGVPASRTKEKDPKDAKAAEPKGQPTTEKH